MSGPWEKYQAAPADGPWAKYQQPPEPAAADPNAPGMAESAIRGGAKGITFGFADEGAAGLMGAKDWASGKLGLRGDIPLGDAYETNLQAIRHRDAQAQEEHPVAFGAGELGGAVVSPVSKVLAPAEGAGVLGVMARGAMGGGLAGAGASTAHPFTSPDELEHFGEDVTKSAALGGALAGTSKILGSIASKMSPEALKKFAREKLMSAAGGEGTPELLAHADEAGSPIVGPFSKASDIGQAARGKQAYFEDASEVGPSWRPFGGPVGTEKEIGGDVIDVAAINRARANANAYRSVAESAEGRAAEEASQPANYMPSMGGFMMSLAHGGNPIKHAATAAAVGLGTKAVKERGAAFAGRAAQGLGEAFESVPEKVGTAAGAVTQYLHTGLGSSAVVGDVMAATPEEAAADRRKRLRQAMIQRLGNLQEQGYQTTLPPP